MTKSWNCPKIHPVTPVSLFPWCLWATGSQGSSGWVSWDWRLSGSCPGTLGEVTRPWSYDCSLSSQDVSSACGACRAPGLMRKRRGWETGATHQGGGEINELCLQIFCGIIQDRQTGMGLGQSPIESPSLMFHEEHGKLPVDSRWQG